MNETEVVETTETEVVKKTKQSLPTDLARRAEEIFAELHDKTLAIATVDQGAAINYYITGNVKEKLSPVTMLNNLYHGKTISCGGKETAITSMKEAIEEIFMNLPEEVKETKTSKTKLKAIETAKEMLAESCSTSLIVKITGLTEQEIEALKE